MQTVLVVGGAGYIGSHMLKALADRGIASVTLDNLSSGHRESVRYGELIEGDLADRHGLRQLFTARRFDAVMHFASFIQVGESMADPAKYYRNNVANTLNLLEAMREGNVEQFIFSSSAAVFGQPEYVPIDENHPLAPLSPYGRSKLMIERILADYAAAYGFRSVSLRYFNAAGAAAQAGLGERHEPETHLIPLILQAAAGRREAITIFGDDYHTPDGTCIRDYIHVNDLCQAHLQALLKLDGEVGARVVNLGNNRGFSVREVIDSAASVTGQPIATHIAARRPGDPAQLIADARYARTFLGWEPEHTALEQIVADAWQFAQSGASFPRG